MEIPIKKNFDIKTYFKIKMKIFQAQYYDLYQAIQKGEQDPVLPMSKNPYFEKTCKLFKIEVDMSDYSNFDEDTYFYYLEMDFKT